MKKRIITVLVRPKFPENIGAAARVVACLGLGQLRLVEPERLWPEPMRRMATSHAWHILDDMTVFPDLSSAIEDCLKAVATTARVGPRRGDLLNPRQMGEQAPEWLEQGQVAMVFGPEDRGLTNEEVDLCNPSVRIPVEPGASLNLAQAVMVMGHEMRMALDDGYRQRPRAHDTTRKPAPHGEVKGLMDHMTRALVELGVVAKDNPPHFFRPYKEILERSQLSQREVRALHGIARQILWLCGHKNRGFTPRPIEEAEMGESQEYQSKFTKSQKGSS